MPIDPTNPFAIAAADNPTADNRIADGLGVLENVFAGRSDLRTQQSWLRRSWLRRVWRGGAGRSDGEIADANDRSAAGRFRSAVIRLIVIVTVIATAAAAKHVGPTMLANHWSEDLTTLPADALRDRLIELAMLGEPGVRVIAEKWIVGDEHVSRSAATVLSDLDHHCRARLSDQRGDTSSNQDAMYRPVIAAVEDRFDDRRVDGGSLMRWLVRSRDVLRDPKLRHRTERLIERLAPQAPLTTATLLSRTPIRIDDDAGNDTGNHDVGIDDGSAPVQSVASPRLRVMTADEPIVLRDPAANAAASIGTSRSPPPNDSPPNRFAVGQTVTAVSNQPSAPVRQSPVATEMVGGAMAGANDDSEIPPAFTMLSALTDRSVFDFLVGEDRRFATMARDELIHRGYDDRALRLAGLVASPVVDDRLTLTRVLVSADHDARRWWLWLLDDASPRVRAETATILATMPDAAARSILRNRLNRETDPDVRNHLRRLLDR